jgi:predicted RecA/RadA family phage recombinase
MKNQILQAADTVQLTAPYAVEAGNGALIGATFAVSLAKLASGEIGQWLRKGAFVLPKATTAGTGGAQGALAYWNNTAKSVTAVSSGNTLIGFFLNTCTDAATTCEVVLS